MTTIALLRTAASGNLKCIGKGIKAIDQKRAFLFCEFLVEIMTLLVACIRHECHSGGEFWTRGDQHHQTEALWSRTILSVYDAQKAVVCSFLSIE